MSEITLRPAVPHHGRPAPDDLVQAARDYIAAAEWTTAKSRNAHEYCVRQRSRSHGLGGGHEALYELCRDYHVDRWWWGRTYRTIELDDWAIWVMEDGTVINRKPAAEAGWTD